MLMFLMLKHYDLAFGNAHIYYLVICQLFPLLLFCFSFLSNIFGLYF